MPSQSPPLEVSVAAPAAGAPVAARPAGGGGWSARRAAALVAVGWASVALYGIALHGLLAAVGVLRLPTAVDVAQHVLGATAGALATPLVLEAARRWPVREGGAGAVLVHLALGATLVVLGTALGRGVCAALFPASTPPLGEWIGHTFQEGIAYYLGLVALGTALAGAKRPRARGPVEAEAEVLRAQLQSLKAQVQPHFLFNTLHAVAHLVRDDPRGAERMVMHLGDLLRATLKAGDAPLVSLREEAATLRAYLGIQKIRYRGRLRVHLGVPDELGSALVPVLVLQPLVENAVRHGAEPKSGPTTIEVTAELEGDDLVLRVRDDGAGPGGGSRRGAGAALRNLSVRLRRLYGAGASLEHGGLAGGGYQATVRVPYAPAQTPSRFGR